MSKPLPDHFTTDFLPYCICPWCPYDEAHRMPIREHASGRLVAQCEDCGGSERVNLTDVTSAVSDGREAVFPERHRRREAA